MLYVNLKYLCIYLKQFVLMYELYVVAKYILN